jgi:hypothetical protein
MIQGPFRHAVAMGSPKEESRVRSEVGWVSFTWLSDWEIKIYINIYKSVYGGFLVRACSAAKIT